MKSDDLVFKRDEEGMHNASSRVIYSNAICSVILLVSIVYLLYAIATHSLFVWSSLILAVLGVLSLVWGIFSDIYFNFYENCKFTFIGKGTCIYEYDLNKDIVGNNNHARVVIKSVRKIRFKRNECTIYGDIVVKKPRKKDIITSKYSCMINCSDDKQKFVSELKKLTGV